MLIWTPQANSVSQSAAWKGQTTAQHVLTDNGRSSQVQLSLGLRFLDGADQEERSRNQHDVIWGAGVKSFFEREGRLDFHLQFLGG